MMNFLIDLKLIEDDVIGIQSRSMSDPPLSDIDFKNCLGPDYPHKNLNRHHKCYSEMADIRQFIRSELSIIKKEVIESTRSMIRNEIRSISFDSNL